MRKTKRQTITVQLHDPNTGDFWRHYDIEKAAVMEGVLAIGHGVLFKDGELYLSKKWKITHVPSGYSLGLYYDTQRHARKVADKLLDLQGIDWDVSSPRAFPQEDRKRILAVIEMYMNEEPEDA